MNCRYHPIFRRCYQCNLDMVRGEQRECAVTPEPSDRVKALREARELIKLHAVMTWNGGLTERSDGITEVLVDFDLKFPEAKQ